MTSRLLIALVFLLAAALTAAAHAQPTDAAAASPPAAGSSELSPAEAQRVIQLLQDPRQRAQLIETLQAISKTAPPPAKPTEPAPAKPASVVALAPHSLGAQLLGRLSYSADSLASEAAATARAVTDFPLLWYWATAIASNPGQRQAVLDSLWRAGLIVGCAWLLGWLAVLVTMRPIAMLAEHAPASEPDDEPVADAATEEVPEEPEPVPRDGAWPLLRRLPFALARLALELVPIGVFWGAGSILAGLTNIPAARRAVLIVVGAYATSRLIISIGRMLASPTIDRLRLLRLDDQQAAYLMTWLRAITIVAVFGSAAIDLAVLFGLFGSAANALSRLVALIVAILVAIVVLRSRHTVAARLRAEPAASGGTARWRNGLAAVWHYLALIAIAAAWIVWASGADDGLGGLWLLVGTIAIVVAARLVAIVALGTLDRGFRLDLAPTAGLAEGRSRAARYQPAARFVVSIVIVAATLVLLMQFWGADTIAWFNRGSIGARLASALLTIAVAGIAAIVVWESANARLERRLTRLTEAGSSGHAARLRTLLPILRAALFIAVLSIVGLTALSQIGIDIAPLLAGAGIVGVAVGFGSQKLVQDVITGMFVLFENAIQIGDVVTVAGLTGMVEQLSVRNIWLRGGDGALHVIPFSAVTSITNSNRGLGNAAVAVTVPFGEDTDRVAETLREIAGEMRADPAFAPLMLGDLQIWIDNVKAWGVSFAGQIVCTDTGRWSVQREFNRRLQKRFQELGIGLSDWYAAQLTPAVKPEQGSAQQA